MGRAIIGPMAESKTRAAPARRPRVRRSEVTAVEVARPAAPEPSLPRGRTAPLDPGEERDLLHRGVSLFNGLRYWHAHEAWETCWRASPEPERDFYQGLIQVAAGLLHLQRRNVRGARNKLGDGLAKLRPYQPAHRGIFVNELVGKCELIERDLRAGLIPYLIPPVIRFADVEHAPDFDR